MKPTPSKETNLFLNLFDLCALLCLLASGWFIYEKIITSGPFETHALIALTRGASASFEEFCANNLSSPGLRPLASLSFVIDHIIFGLNVSFAYIENICWLALCLWIAYLFFRKISGHAYAALIATIFVITDYRFLTVVKWLTGRQTTMATAFGFTALLLAISLKYKTNKILYGFIIFLLLISSVLCKEYGIIFILCLPICVFMYARHRIMQAIVAASTALCSYAILRMLLVPNRTIASIANDTMAYWGKIKTASVSSNLFDFDNLLQIIYNILAGLISGFLPGLSDNYYGYAGIINANYYIGSIWNNLNYMSFVLIPFFLFICLATSKKIFTIGSLLVILNALLCFAVFRQRNLLIGAVGFWMMVCFGANQSIYWLRSKSDKTNLAQCLILSLITIGCLYVSTNAARIHSNLAIHIKSKCPLVNTPDELKVNFSKTSTIIYKQLLIRYSPYIKLNCSGNDMNTRK